MEGKLKGERGRERARGVELVWGTSLGARVVLQATPSNPNWRVWPARLGARGWEQYNKKF